MHDIVRHTPITCGHGSAAASLIAYCLFITHVDPIRHNLFFGRFINRGRIDPPDIDIDFPWDTRDDVLNYVFAKYGVEQAAMVFNHVTFKQRGAVHEVAKVYGFPEREIMDITGKMSYSFSLSDEPITNHPALQDHGFPEPWPEILHQAVLMDGIPRYLSVHCGGVVVTPGDTANWVPTQKAKKGVRIVHWEKDQTEDSGLVKIDLLGNRPLSVIRDTLAMINTNYGTYYEYASLNPLDDPATQEMIAQGNTMGVFLHRKPCHKVIAAESRCR